MSPTSPLRRVAAGVVAVGVVTVGVGLLAGCTAASPRGQAPTTSATATPTDPRPSEPEPAVDPAPSPSRAQSPSASPFPSPSPFIDHGPALVSATWGQHEGGRSLAVVPADWVRTSDDFAAVDQLWAELVEAQPEADTPVMYDQLVCHVVGAPDKPSWNLEPWRPDVGLLAVMHARCNPT